MCLLEIDDHHILSDSKVQGRVGGGVQILLIRGWSEKFSVS